MNKNKIRAYFYLVILGLLKPAIIFADGHTGSPDGATETIKNPIKSNTIMELLGAILDILVRVGTPIIILAFIYVGFRFVEAQGKPDKLSDARRAFTYTVVGTAVLLGARALSVLIDSTVQSLF